MKLARYLGHGEIAIVEEPKPACPAGGLLVRNEASGLCSGELMDWYMDRKIPHVLGHEVAGIVEESDDPRFAAGSRVFVHHHAPCLHCEFCRTGRHVHCEQWRRTKLIPGGMAEYFAVPAENLNDTLLVDALRAIDAALVEPLACVAKSVGMATHEGRAAVIGLGVMGLMHMLLLRASQETVAYELSARRRAWACELGLDAREPSEREAARVVYVCPGSQAAFDLALQIVEPGGTVVLFAPLPPMQVLQVPQNAYFLDLHLVHSYSCGPMDTEQAAGALRQGRLRAEQVVSDFIAMSELPAAYRRMKDGEILKPMVVFPSPSQTQ